MSSGCYLLLGKQVECLALGVFTPTLLCPGSFYTHNVGETTDKSRSLQRGWRPEGMPDGPKAAEPGGGHGVCLQII